MIDAIEANWEAEPDGLGAIIGWLDQQAELRRIGWRRKQ